MAPLFVAFGLREPHSEMIDAKSGGNGIPLRVRFMQIICQQPRWKRMATVVVERKRVINLP